MAEAKQDVTRMLDSYTNAVLAKDVEAFVDLYDENVYVFDMWNSWSYEGRAAWRGLVEEWFGSLGDEQVGVEFTEVGVTAAGDMAVAHTTVTYKGLSAEGEELRRLDNRMTWGLTKSNGSWKVVHEHSSAPADLETAKVILARPRS